jgi:hypothetical protein
MKDTPLLSPACKGRASHVKFDPHSVRFAATSPTIDRGRGSAGREAWLPSSTPHMWGRGGPPPGLAFGKPEDRLRGTEWG